MYLRRASSLTDVNLAFFLGYNDPSNAQTSVVCSLVAGILPGSLTSLLLVADYVVRDVFTTPSFASLISSLTRLCIITCLPNARDLETFWQDVVSAHFLQPTMATLTSLVLHPDVFIGTFTTVPFASVFFPCLTRLSLKMFLFEPTNNLEDFIIRHSPTLTHLHLKECPIVTYYIVDSIRFQSDIWRHFARKLGVLAEIIVTEEWDTITEHYEHGTLSRYMTCGTARYKAYNRDYRVEVPDRIKEDDMALQMLDSMVDARSRAPGINGIK
jgi:hypothetical protein